MSHNDDVEKTMSEFDPNSTIEFISAEDDESLAHGVSQLKVDSQDELYNSKISFSELLEGKVKYQILEGLHQCGFNNPSKIQQSVLPIIVNEPNINIIAQSQSGTGKTLCFSIGILEAIDPTKNETQAICITPTFELAQQTYDVISKIAQSYEGIRIRKAVKGEKIQEPISHHIVIGTPGKIADWIKFRYINTKNIRLLVLDEADEILAQTTSSMTNQTKRIKRSVPKNCRVFLFSATYKEEITSKKKEKGAWGYENKDDQQKEEHILDFAQQIVPEPRKFILLPREKLTLDKMRQYYIVCDSPQDKVDVLSKIYATLEVGQCIIFVNRRDFAENLTTAMEKAGHSVSLVHGQISPDDRALVVRKFRDNVNKVLISTNLISRGLDVRTVTHVVNFELPVLQDGSPDTSTYLHRIGRTARFGSEGVAVNFVQGEADERNIKLIQDFFKTEIIQVDKDKIEEEIR